MSTPTRSDEGFFNPDPAWLPEAEKNVPRDSRDRPLIVPPCAKCRQGITYARGTGEQITGCPECPTEPEPYERISRVVNAADTLQWLMDWRLGMAVRGMAMSRDLAYAAAGLEWNDPQMRDIIEKAHDRAGGNDDAHWGTGFHRITEPGVAPEAIPEEMIDDVACFDLALEEAGMRIVATEMFVVNDQLRVAGTFDHIVVVDGRDKRMILDKKTGRFSAKNAAVQESCYANGEYVDMDLIAEEQWSPRREIQNLDREVAVVAHVPRDGGKRASLRPVDIALGYERAEIALAGKELDDRADWVVPGIDFGKVDAKKLLARRIDNATSHSELRDLMKHYDGVATKALRERANKRWVQIRENAH